MNVLSIFCGGDYMYDRKISNSFILVLLSVFFVSLIFNLFIRNEADFNYLVLDINDISNIVIQNKIEVIQYILIHRIKQLILLIILIKAFGIEKIYNIMLVVCGGVIGLMVSIQVYYLGIEGLIILLIYIFPHYILYVMSLCFGIKVKLFHIGMEDNLKKFVTFCSIFLFGIAVECSFLTIFLKNFYQYMVTKI